MPVESSSSRVRSQSWKPTSRRGQSLLDVEAKAAALQTVFNENDFKSSKEPRKYTADEKAWMSQYESVDTFEPQTRLYKDHLSSRAAEPRGFIWFYVFFIGLMSGVVAIALVSLLHLFFAIKMKVLAAGLNDFSTFGDPDDVRFGAAHDSSLTGMSDHNFAAGYCTWILFSLGSAILASTVAYFVPECIGLGTPEVTAYLNGIENTAMYKPRVIFAKFLTVLFSVVSGLPIGHFGTIVQLGTMCGSLLMSRSLPARLRNLTVVRVFRNPRDKRILNVIGAAAGVASAFGVSIGGLAFVMEQLSTVFPVRFAVYVFVTCLVAVTTIQTYFSYIAYFSMRDRNNLGFGELLSDALIQFDTRLAGVTPISMNLFDFIPATAIGLGAGLLSALFIRINWVSLRLRRRIQARFRIVRFIEPVVIAVVYSTVMFWITVSFGSELTSDNSSDACRRVPATFSDNRNTSVVSFYGLNGLMCMSDVPTSPKNGSTSAPGDVSRVFQPFGSLALGFADSTAQQLLSWRTGDAYSAVTLVVFFLFYFIFAAVTSGAALSGDVLLPLLVLGGAYGRLIGKLVEYLASGAYLSTMWADPGAFAIIGAGAFLGGATGLTFSVGIIMIELTNNFRHTLCIMLAISIAKKVSESFAHSIGISYLESKCVPLLDFAQQVEKYDMFCAKHVMAAPPITLRNMDTITNIIETVAPTSHHGFPVVSVIDGTFIGVVHRKQLLLVLWNIYLTNSMTVITYDQLKLLEDQGYLEKSDEDVIPPFSDEVLEWRLDLNPYVDTSAYCVQEATTMSRTYNMFRTLGLRQLAVINRENKVTGVITRKDLLADNILDRILRENNRRERARRDGTEFAASKRSNSAAGTPSAAISVREVEDGPGSPTRGRRLRDVEWIVTRDEDADEFDMMDDALVRNQPMHPQSQGAIDSFQVRKSINDGATNSTVSDASPQPKGDASKQPKSPTRKKKTATKKGADATKEQIDEIFAYADEVETSDKDEPEASRNARTAALKEIADGGSDSDKEGSGRPPRAPQ